MMVFSVGRYSCEKEKNYKYWKSGLKLNSTRQRKRLNLIRSRSILNWAELYRIFRASPTYPLLRILKERNWLFCGICTYVKQGIVNLRNRHEYHQLISCVTTAVVCPSCFGLMAQVPPVLCAELCSVFLKSKFSKNSLLEMRRHPQLS